MCLYPRIMKNRKYVKNKKNRGVIPPCNDERVKLVPVACGNCMQCRKAKAREWAVRLQEDIKTNKNGKFITLTFSNENIKEIVEKIEKQCKEDKIQMLEGYELDNEIATRGTRWFLERWRKKFKKSIRHWLITELGHNGTENIHLHGIIWTNEGFDTIARIWKYGYIWPRATERKVNYVNGRTVNYIVKYISKMDFQHKKYKSKMLTSAGIGGNYINTMRAKDNNYQKGETDETYRTETGHKITIPIYWRNKIYTEEEREKLWLEKLDKGERWVGKIKIKTKDGEEAYYNALKQARKRNKELGYGDDVKDWSREQYEKERRIIRITERIKNTKAPSAGSNQKG